MTHRYNPLDPLNASGLDDSGLVVEPAIVSEPDPYVLGSAVVSDPILQTTVVSEPILQTTVVSEPVLQTAVVSEPVYAAAPAYVADPVLVAEQPVAVALAEPVADYSHAITAHPHRDFNDIDRIDNLPINPSKKGGNASPLIYIVAALAAIVSIVPVLFVILGGFRTNADLAQNPAGLPNPIGFGNFREILVGQFADRFWGQVLASAFIALMTTALVVLLGVSVAYAIARFDGMRGRNLLYALFAAGLMFPATIAILPISIMLQWLHLFGNWWGVIIPQVAFALPTTVVILTPFIRAIPKEMEEAAFIDGATRTSFFFKILLPLAKSGMVTVGVLAFIGSWNSYLLPLFVLGVGGAPTERHTLPLGVQMFTTQFSANTVAIMAFTSLAMIPALIFFLAMEKHIVNGLSGAVKG